MSKIIVSVTDRSGADKEISAASGGVLMEILRDQVDINIGICGGVMSCGTCRVLIDADWAARLTPAGGEETEMLDALGEEKGARLACQLELTAALDGLRLTIAPVE